MSTPPAGSRDGGQGVERRARAGFAFTLAGQIFQTATSLATAMILARLLDPEIYGLLGMVLVLVGLLHLLNDSGLGAATIQKESVSDDELTNVFWLQLALSLAVGLFSAASAPLVAWIYGEPRLLPLALAFTPIFIIIGVTAPFIALLYRQLRYERVAMVNAGASVLGSASAIAVAYFGGGVWALLALRSVPYVVVLVVLVSLSDWRPTWPKRGVSVGHQLSFGSRYLGTKLVEYGTMALDRFLVGTWFGAATLGLYERGSTILASPLTQLAAPMNRVVFPALSRVQDEPVAFRAIFLQNFRTLCWLTLPLVGILVSRAEDIVLILLGPKWVESTYIFLFASAGAAVTPVLMTRSWVLLSRGQTSELLRLEAFSSAALVVVMVLVAPFGPEALAGLRSAWLFVMVFVSLSYAFRGTLLKLSDALRRAAEPALVAGAAVIIGNLPFVAAIDLAVLRVLVVATFVASVALALMVRSGEASTLASRVRQSWRDRRA